LLFGKDSSLCSEAMLRFFSNASSCWI
jgi:hypothetical protein